jgi:hypothetical protein
MLLEKRSKKRSINILERGADMKKWKIAVSAVALAIVVLASVFAFYAFEPAVGYWQDTSYMYQKVGGNWITTDFEGNVIAKGCFATVYSQSLGGAHASFDLVVTLTNATFSDNAQTATVSYNLQDQQEHSTNLTFAVKDGVESFSIALSFQPHQLFLRGQDRNWDSQNPIAYYNYSNNTYEPALLL